MNFDDPVNPRNQLHRINIKALQPDMCTDRVLKSIKRGRIYEASLSILRAQMASGLDCLDDKCLSGMGLETLFDDNMTFIAAIALSRPTMDYEALMTYALNVRERSEIIKDLQKVIKKFGYQKSYYHFLIAQQSHDEAITSIFDLTGANAPKMVAPHGDLAAMKRLSKLFKLDHKTMTDMALAYFPNERAETFREKLTGKAAMSNFEFTERMQTFFRQKAGLTRGLFDEETVESYTLDQIRNMPDFDRKLNLNAAEVVKSFYQAIRQESDLAQVDELEAIERVVISPLLENSENRMALFFDGCLGRNTSWIRDILDTPDGGRQYYLQSLVDSASSNYKITRLSVRAFVHLEPVRDLLALCMDEDTVSKLYGITANTNYLREASPRVRDQAMAQDLGL